MTKASVLRVGPPTTQKSKLLGRGPVKKKFSALCADCVPPKVITGLRHWLSGPYSALVRIDSNWVQFEFK